MNYQIIEKTDIDGNVTRHVDVDNGDGSFTSFPVDENNPEYIQFVAKLGRNP